MIEGKRYSIARCYAELSNSGEGGRYLFFCFDQRVNASLTRTRTEKTGLREFLPGKKKSITQIWHELTKKPTHGTQSSVAFHKR